jgi:hypothetical protein
MAFSFSIRVVDSDGDPRESVRVQVSDPRPIGDGSLEEYTDADGWAYFEWPNGSSAGFDVYVDGEEQGYHSLEDDDTLSFTV